MEKTLIMAKKLNNTDFSLAVIGICTPFPGTDLWNRREEYRMKFLTNRWARYDLSTPIFETRNISAEDLKKGAFYFNNALFDGDSLPGLSSNKYEEFREQIDTLINEIEVAIGKQTK